MSFWVILGVIFAIAAVFATWETHMDMQIYKLRKEAKKKEKEKENVD